MTGHGLADWLARQHGDALAALLDRRPDVLAGHPPATLGQLAERLGHPSSLVQAVRGLTTPALQALEALRALGERRTRAALGELLHGRPGPEHEAAVDAALTQLGAAALVWPGAGDRLELPAGLAEIFPRPLGLGSPARELWQDQNVEAIARAVRALGGRAEGRKADKLAALLPLLADPDRVRARAEAAPPQVAMGLRQLVWGDQGDDQGDDEDDEYLDHRYDPELWKLRHEAERWAVDHGLLPASPWGGAGRLPAEVGLALRGPGFRAPFLPDPPPLESRPVTEQAVESAAAAAVTAFATHALALLDRLARTPVPQLAGGGIGTRELGRLTKELGVDESELRLALELAASCGLLRKGAGPVGVSERFTTWREAEPARQALDLLTAWWDFPTVPTRSRGADGKTMPAVRRPEPCAGCQAARYVLVGMASALAAGTATDAAGLAEAARWNRPMVHVLPQDAEAPLATVYREAELLGVLAAGALSPVGAALLADDLAGAEGHLRRLLPQPCDTALFGSDLTALVAGTPSARVSALLDGCADRESSGGAVTWRFSPASVRRALDAGTTAGQLVEQLSAIAERDLPQPLGYLIADVGRRHGRLRLLPAVSLIRGDGTALLAEVAADRRLARLGLQLVAPTILACAVPLEAALARLREAGYFPVPDIPVSDAPAAPDARPAPPDRQGTDGTAPPARTLRELAAATRQEPKRRRAAEPAEPAEVARRLLAAGDTGVPAPASGAARELAHLTRGLSPSEIDWLAAAIDEGGRVRIEYQAASGAVTDRVITDPELLGGTVYAWCELRQDERMFTAARILSVSPA